MKDELKYLLLQYHLELIKERDSTNIYDWSIRYSIIKKINAIELLLNINNSQTTKFEGIWKTIKQIKNSKNERTRKPL